MLFAMLVSAVSVIPLLAMMFTLTGCLPTETLTAILPILVEWWSFLSFAAIAWTAGQAAKHLAPPPSTAGWRIFWRTLPYHPVVFGMIFGATGIGPLPEAFVKAHGTGPLYYGFAGVIAVYSHDLWKTWVKYKHMDEKAS